MSTVDDAVIEYDIWTRVQALLKQHIPSITRKAEEADPNRDALAIPIGSFGIYEYDGAYRECACGRIIEGYYEYNDHLEEVFRAAH